MPTLNEQGVALTNEQKNNLLLGLTGMEHRFDTDRFHCIRNAEELAVNLTNQCGHVNTALSDP